MLNLPLTRDALLAAAKLLLQGTADGQRFWLRSELVTAIGEFPPRVTSDAIGYMIQRGLATSVQRRVATGDDGLSTEEVEVLQATPSLRKWWLAHRPDGESEQAIEPET